MTQATLPTISVCIPTCNRPALLKEALESVLNQTLLPLEIIVGDDSRDDSCEAVVAAISGAGRVPIIHKRNSPPLGQAANANKLFESASGQNLVLLHDDDLLLPNALEDLSACWNDRPELTAAYGKQYLVSERGDIQDRASQDLNRDYFRGEEWAGSRLSAAAAGVLQQFPNDCYMVRSSAARAVKCRPREEVGNACDYDFGLRLGIASREFFFLDKFIAKYRMTAQSLSKSSTDDAAMQAFSLLQQAAVPHQAVWAKEFQLRRLAPAAISQLIREGRSREAVEIFFSKNYPLSKRVHPRGIRQLAKALLNGRGPAPSK